MEEPFMRIGEVAEQAGIATSAVRYYERRGLVAPDARVAGQRRYKDETLRRVVFIGMLQDAGLSLDDIADVLGAGDVNAWKAVAAERLAQLTAEIERLQMASCYLEGALLCTFDHPLTECQIMNTEISRRLRESTS